MAHLKFATSKPNSNFKIPISSLPVISYIPRFISNMGCDILKYNFHENLCNLIETLLKFVPMNIIPAFVQLASMSFKCIFF